MGSTADLLRHAKAIIADPHHWTKGTYAKDKYGSEISYGATTATCFCASGAVRRAAQDGEYHTDIREVAFQLLRSATKRVLRKGRSAPVPEFNDANHRTHDQVMRMFDYAIKAAEKDNV